MVFSSLSSHPVTSSLAVCGKHPTFDPERPTEAHWPWLVAIYRRFTNGAGTKVTKADRQAGSLKGDVEAGTGRHDRAPDWQLVCSGALVNQKRVVVAAHCVTELEKVYPLDAAKIKVVVGKQYRDDHRESKGLQHLRVSDASACLLMLPLNQTYRESMSFSIRWPPLLFIQTTIPIFSTLTWLWSSYWTKRGSGRRSCRSASQTAREKK